MTTTTSAATYRKTKSGEWVAYGLHSILRDARTVAVTKRDGTTKTETIARVGQPFLVDGRYMAYGYLGVDIKTSRAATSPRRTYSYSRSCEDCQMVEDCGDCGGCSRHRGNPQN